MGELPRDFSDALKATGLERFFLTYSSVHQREYLKWIEEAKRPETRKNRIEKTVEMLRSKRSKETAGAKKKV